MKIERKAWTINNSNFYEPWFAPQDVYYADTRSKAKTLILSEIKYDGFKDRDEHEISYLTLKINRAKQADMYLVDGSLKTLHDIEYSKRVEAKNKEIDTLVKNNPTAKAYIRKGCRYYKSDYCGYTEHVLFAGVYTIQQAAGSVKACSLDDNMQVVMIDKKEHNEMIMSQIKELQSRFIDDAEPHVQLK